MPVITQPFTPDPNTLTHMFCTGSWGIQAKKRLKMAGKDPSPKVGKRKGGAKARKAAKAAEAAAIAGVDGMSLAEKGTGDEGPQARNASGILASEARARDIKIQSFSLSFHSKILVEDSTIEMNFGRRCA